MNVNYGMKDRNCEGEDIMTRHISFYFHIM